jgi:alkane 1-monooxygenase
MNVDVGLHSSTYPAWHHLRVLVTPVLCFIYFLLAPKWIWLSAAFFSASLVLDYFAEKSGVETGKPSNDFKAWHFSVLLYVLFTIHWINLYFALAYLTEVGILSLQAPFILYMLFISGGITGPITGHELAHSNKFYEHWMGRLLYCGFLHDHWWVDHAGCHHKCFGTKDDPSTAHLDETLWQFFIRFFPSQARSAWRLESQRLRKENLIMRLLRNTLIHGFTIEALFLATAYVLFGSTGVLVFIVQAIVLTLGLHTVNYFQHWGLVRNEKNALCCWDSNNRSTLFSMLGLLRHSDHHKNSHKRYYELDYMPDTPKLPYGFGGMIALAIFTPRRFNRLMRAELQRLDLLPGKRKIHANGY